MGLRGPKPKGKVKIEWSSNFAYAIGLIVSDGNLSSDGRHILFTSKDKELALKFQNALNISGHIGKKASVYDGKKKYFVVQFSDVLFYHFLLSIGLMANKSKIIGRVKIPKKYFFDFLRGSFDGDGSFYSYFDPRWKSSFMFYLTFVSASKKHIDWMRGEIVEKIGTKGHISKSKLSTVHQLRFAKADSLKILKKMYRNPKAICLSRKRLKISKVLGIVGKHIFAQVS